MSEKRKILIIDDDIDFRETAKVVLESVGFEVLEAGDGKDGLEKAKQEDVCFILLDVMMEEVDSGVQLANKIAEAKPDIPVVILSSFADAARQTFDVTKVPVKEYLQKPLKSDQLLQIVEKYVK